MAQNQMTDTAGVTLDRNEVTDIAFGNICASMSVEELARLYITTQSDGQLLQWATDEDGKFPVAGQQKGG